MRDQVRKGIIKRILAILISMGIPIFINSPTFGADWKFLQKNEKGEFFYDAENMVISSEQTIGVWLKVVYSVTFKEQEGLKDLQEAVGFWEIRCKEREIRLLLLSHVSEEKGEEVPSPPRVFQTPDWEPIAPDTILNELHGIVCKQ